MPFAQNDGVRIYYEAVGDGEPVLWLQGVGADHRAWSVQMFHFSRRFRCILPDNRDVGRSGRATSGYDLDDMARDALSVLDSAGVERAHVVGLSMGGSIAQHVALLASERVRSLALLSSCARPDGRLRAVTGLWPELFARLGRVMFHRQAEPWMFSPEFFEHPANLRALRRYVEEDEHGQEPEAFARQAAAASAQDALVRLGEIRARTLVISGELDILVPPYLGRQLAEGIPGARFELIEGVAHSVNLERQKIFNRALEGFLLEG